MHALPMFRRNRLRLMIFISRVAVFLKKYEKSLAILLAVCAVLGGVATYLALSSAPPLGRDPETITWLLTFDLIVLLALGTLVAQRVVGLYLGRRRGSGASHLHVRMVLLFSFLATAPAVLLVLFSMFFFQLGVQAWFSTEVRTAVTEAQAVAEAYLDEHRKIIRSDILALAGDIDRQSTVVYASPEDLRRFMDTQSFLRNFTEAVLFDGSGNVIGRGGVGLSFDPDIVPPGTLQSTQIQDAVIYTVAGRDEKIQAIARLNNVPDTYVYVARDVDPKVLSYVTASRNAAHNYTQLEGRRSDLQTQFFAVYLMVAMLLLFAAVWGGLYVAGQLVNPIDNLIDAAEQVRDGNLSTRVPEQQGLDEFDDLARTFNRMIIQLEQQRRELISANHKLDERRRFTETILGGVTSGVMAVDSRGHVRLANEPAVKILGFKHEALLRRSITEIIPDLKMPRDGEAASQQEISYIRRDQQRRHLLVRFASDVNDEGASGHVMTFDDITELQSVQRKSAWGDVARRVAHEIKNPLTPIQLSAERLRRRFLKDIPEADQSVFQQCIDTIIRHVGDIGRMVAEFASFARMPEPVMRDDDLAQLVHDMVTLHGATRSDVKVEVGGLLADRGRILPVLMDPQQMRQALTNLVLNAIESVGNRIATQPEPAGRVMIYAQARDGQYILSVFDNGLGFPSGVALERLTEPYVTFRDKGTGLGLAIVKKITEDHKGSLRLDGPDGVRDSAHWGAQGAVVSLILPIPLDQHDTVVQDTSYAA
jgi:two-component system, NtrC family, nitrogen regulation sensor histidine kinase NtrY